MLFFRSYFFMIMVVLLFALYRGIYVLVSDTPWWLKVFAAVTVVFVLILGTRRDTYLPFLGTTVMPAALLKTPTEAVGDVTSKLYINMPDGTPVVYWASMPSDTVIEDPFKAYAEFKNSNMAVVKNKTAELRVECPSKYKIPSGRTLQPHVHYRVVYKNGLLGPVETVNVVC